MFGTFLSKSAKSVLLRSFSVGTKEFKKVGVVGLGLMGHGFFFLITKKLR